MLDVRHRLGLSGGLYTELASVTTCMNLYYSRLSLFSGLRSKCTSPYLGAACRFAMGGNNSLIGLPSRGSDGSCIRGGNCLSIGQPEARATVIVKNSGFEERKCSSRMERMTTYMAMQALTTVMDGENMVSDDPKDLNGFQTSIAKHVNLRQQNSFQECLKSGVSCRLTAVLIRSFTSPCCIYSISRRLSLLSKSFATLLGTILVSKGAGAGCCTATTSSNLKCWTMCRARRSLYAKLRTSERVGAPHDG